MSTAIDQPLAFQVATRAPAPRIVSADDSAKRRSIKELLLPLFLQVGTTANNLRADSAGFWRAGEDGRAVCEARDLCRDSRR